MEGSISEADWRHLRRLKLVTLDRFCRRVVSEVVGLASDDATGGHERYLSIYTLIHERDGEMAAAFNDLRRSTALVRLARMRSLGLITDAEFCGFSDETQAVVSTFLEVWKA